MLTSRGMIPTSTILDENGQTLKKLEEKFARWQRHFAEVLNIQNGVAEKVVSELDNQSHGKTPEVTKEEVERAVRQLRNARQEDRMKWYSRTVEEWRRGSH